jgi:hypothetical protein
MLNVVWESRGVKYEGTSLCACWVNVTLAGGNKETRWIDVVERHEGAGAVVVLAKPKSGASATYDGYDLIDALDSCGLVVWAEARSLSRGTITWLSADLDLFESGSVVVVELDRIRRADLSDGFVVDDASTGVRLAFEPQKEKDGFDRSDDLTCALGFTAEGTDRASLSKEKRNKGAPVVLDGNETQLFALKKARGPNAKKKPIAFRKHDGGFLLSNSFAWGGMGKVRYAFVPNDDTLHVAKELRMDSSTGALSRGEFYGVERKTNVSGVEDVELERKYLDLTNKHGLSPMKIEHELKRRKLASAGGVLSGLKAVAENVLWIMPYAYGDAGSLFSDPTMTADERRRLGRLFLWDMAAQIARFQALEPAPGIVHCDFKPGNTLIVEAEPKQSGYRIVLADFGAVKKVDEDLGVCTKGYVHPTLFFLESKSVQPANDYYALARSWFELMGAELRCNEAGIDQIGQFVVDFCKPDPSSDGEARKDDAGEGAPNPEREGRKSALFNGVLAKAVKADPDIANWLWENVVAQRPEGVNKDGTEWRLMVRKLTEPERTLNENEREAVLAPGYCENAPWLKKLRDTLKQCVEREPAGEKDAPCTSAYVRKRTLEHAYSKYRAMPKAGN